jgi:hypothetical protein
MYLLRACRLLSRRRTIDVAGQFGFHYLRKISERAALVALVRLEPRPQLVRPRPHFDAARSDPS